MTTTVYSSIEHLDEEFLELINPNKSAYFSRDLLYSFETSNAQVNERYICISNNNIPQALALVQIIELSVDVILKKNLCISTGRQDLVASSLQRIFQLLR